jgi:hypothetical protein
MSAAPIPAGGALTHIGLMMNTTPPRTPDLPERPVQGALDQETIAPARQSPWEPGASAGAPKVLVGLAGAAIVGGIALAVVLMGPAPGAKKHATTDQVAAAQVARDPAAQMNAEPPAAGTAPAADTGANATAQTPAPTATPSDQGSVQAPAAAPSQPAATVPPPVATPPNPDRAPGSTTPTPGE